MAPLYTLKDAQKIADVAATKIDRFFITWNFLTPKIHCQTFFDMPHCGGGGGYDANNLKMLISTSCLLVGIHNSQS